VNFRHGALGALPDWAAQSALLVIGKHVFYSLPSPAGIAAGEPYAQATIDRGSWVRDNESVR